MEFTLVVTNGKDYESVGTFPNWKAAHDWGSEYVSALGLPFVPTPLLDPKDMAEVLNHLKQKENMDAQAKKEIPIEPEPA